MRLRLALALALCAATAFGAAVPVYLPNTGTVANTIPVRNGSGLLPGDITGNAATATTATDPAAVHLTGTQTIAGFKNFSGGMRAADIIVKGPHVDARYYPTIEEAVAAGNLGNGKVLPVLVPAETFTATTPIQMYSGMTIIGVGGSNNEFDRRATIKNSTTDLFSFPGADVYDVTLIGISFQGDSANMDTYAFEPQNTGTGYILKYSTIHNCGFNWFTKAVSGRWLGVHFYENYVNHCISGALEVAGSDNIIRDNFLNAYQTVVANTVFVVKLVSCSLTKFSHNYITGWPAMPLYVSGGNGNHIDSNWFDYSDGAAVYLTGTHGHAITNNFYRGNVAAPFAQYDGINVLFDSYDIVFTGNQYIGQTSGVKTYRFRKSSTGCSNIAVGPNIYESPLVPAYTADVDGITGLRWYEQLADTDTVVFGGLGIGGTPRQNLSVGSYLDLYSGSANSPAVPSIRATSSDALILSAHGSGNLYLNFDGGTGGVNFGNGAGVVKARVDSAGAITPGTSNFSGLGTVLAAGAMKYCTDCTTAATCAGSGTGHMAVSNGSTWTCQ